MNALYKSARNLFASAFWLHELHDLNIRVHDTERDKRIIHYRNDRLHVVTCGCMWLHVTCGHMWLHVFTCGQALITTSGLRQIRIKNDFAFTQFLSVYIFNQYAFPAARIFLRMLCQKFLRIAIFSPFLPSPLENILTIACTHEHSLFV